MECLSYVDDLEVMIIQHQTQSVVDRPTKLVGTATDIITMTPSPLSC